MIGIVIGVAAAVIATRLVASMVYGVMLLDAATFAIDRVRARLGRPYRHVAAGAPSGAHGSAHRTAKSMISLHGRRWALVLAGVAVVAAAISAARRVPAPTPNPAGSFAFAALGDAPYYRWEQRRFRIALRDMDAQRSQLGRPRRRHLRQALHGRPLPHRARPVQRPAPSRGLHSRRQRVGRLLATGFGQLCPARASEPLAQDLFRGSSSEPRRQGAFRSKRRRITASSVSSSRTSGGRMQESRSRLSTCLAAATACGLSRSAPRQMMRKCSTARKLRPRGCASHLRSDGRTSASRRSRIPWHAGPGPAAGSAAGVRAVCRRARGGSRAFR